MFVFQQVTKEVTVTGLQFIFMHLLLKVSNHAALLIENPKREASGFSRSICKAVFAEFPQFYSQTKDAAFRTLSDPKYCGKMKVRSYNKMKERNKSFEMKLCGNINIRIESFDFKCCNKMKLRICRVDLEDWHNES